MSQQVTDEVDVASPPVSVPVSSSATPLGSSYADLAAAEDLGEDLDADEADVTVADDAEQPVVGQTPDLEVGGGLGVLMQPWHSPRVRACGW